MLVVPTEASDAAQINHVLSGVIDQMTADERLLSFLAAQAVVARWQASRRNLTRSYRRTRCGAR